MINVQSSNDQDKTRVQGTAGIKGTTRFIVQANQSMSWKANMWLAASLGVVCLGIAIAMAAFGFWMIIPFAGAEIIFIVFCLHWTLHRLSRKEVITVNEDKIKLEWGYKSPDTSVDLPRRWSRLRYHRPESPFEVGHLSLGAHGKHYALGQCLGRDEKQTLYVELDSVLKRGA